ncbi:MAG: hypothetical protein ACT4O1_04850 [Gemmatimonadota bacterium]
MQRRFFATACADNPIDPNVKVQNSALLDELNDTSKYLPYGVPIPEGVILTKPPQPYNRLAHGLPIANTMAAHNLARTSRNEVPTVKRGGRPTQIPETGDAGYSGFNVAGLLVRNDAQRDVAIPTTYAEDVLVYAPTHLAHGQACIEFTTVHRKIPNGSSTRHYHGFWDWCNGQYFRVYEEMTANWVGKYVRLYGVGNPAVPEEAFYAEVHADNPSNPVGSCWRGLVYNFTAGVWEQKIVSCGTSTLSNYGWTAWESYGLQEYNRCPAIPSIQAQWIRKYTTSSTWVEMETADMLLFRSGYCFDNRIWDVVQPIGPYHWKALTPS